MAGRPKGEPAPPPEAAREALYAAPLAEFVPLRARLAAELRARGEKQLAAAVLAVHKPNVPAWGLNQLARRHPERVAALYEARAGAERVQARGDPSELRDAISRYRAELDGLTRWVEGCLVDAGSPASREGLRGVRASLEAASLDPARLGAELAAGCLVKAFDGDEPPSDLAVPSFAPVRPAAPPAVATAGSPPRPPPAPRTNVLDLAAKRRIEHARRSLEEASAALEAAESREASARTDLARAELVLTEAKESAASARDRLEAARRAVLAAEGKTGE
jgi:hypothetical protein